MSRQRCLITAGPTREHLDPVRFLSNGSSGKMGYALAAAAVARGWQVDLVSGPVSLPVPEGVRVRQVVSAVEMYRTCAPLFKKCNIFIAVAAVADYRPKKISSAKIKKKTGPIKLELVPTVDILKTLAAKKRPGQVVVGFAAETRALLKNARLKLKQKNLDWIVANKVGKPGLGMNADRNAVVVLGADGSHRKFGPAPKSVVAKFVLKCVAGQ